MGIFGSIKTRWKMSEAAVVVEKLLERQVQMGLVELDPLRVANKLVRLVWMEKPDIYEGKFGQRPHKLTVAATALAKGIQTTPEGDRTRKAFAFALSEIRSDYICNGEMYPLTDMDHRLIITAMDTLNDETVE